MLIKWVCSEIRQGIKGLWSSYVFLCCQGSNLFYIIVYSLIIEVELEHPTCKPDFLFPYFKLLFRISYSTPLAGFVISLIFNPLALFCHRRLSTSMFLPWVLWAFDHSASYKVELVRKMAVIFPMRIQYVDFQFVCHKPSIAVHQSLWVSALLSGLVLHPCWIHFSYQMCKPNC